MENAELKALPTGIEHGTVTVVADKRNYEITTFEKILKQMGEERRSNFLSPFLKMLKDVISVLTLYIVNMTEQF